MKALTALLTTAILLTALTARADESEIQPGEMLTALIANSASIKLEDASESIADTLGHALAVDIMAARQDKRESTVLNSVSGRCNATDVGKFGVVYYDCSLTILDGDYKVTPNGYEGPELESSITFTFAGTKKLNGGKFRLKGKKVRMLRAG